jgi:hypothetical protein
MLVSNGFAASEPEAKQLINSERVRLFGIFREVLGGRVRVFNERVPANTYWVNSHYAKHCSVDRGIGRTPRRVST